MPRVKVNKAELYYEVIGEGFPLILLHGASGDRLDWIFQLPLSNRYKLVMPDLRGHGKSERLKGEYTIGDLASDIEGLIEKIDIKRAIICGHSTGGMVALELALNYPEMVEALILVDTASQWPAVGDWISQLKTQGFEEAMRYNMFLAFNDDFSASPAGSMFLEYLAKERVPNLDPNSIMGMLEAIGKSNLTARLSEIRARTLILVGEKDAMIPPTYSEEIHKHIAGSKYVVIKDSKHCLQQNRPSEFNQVVLDFLREIEC